MTTALTVERLRNLLQYTPETGVFVWLMKTTNRIRIGETAGSTTGENYRKIQINGKNYGAHRLAWLYMTGEWPPHEVDHRDNKRSNNCWDNLRSATHSLNQANALRPRNNTSGFKGVSLVKHTNRWRARIRANNRTFHLGCFATAKGAHAAYVEAAKRFFGEFASGGVEWSEPKQEQAA